ncbi:YkvA family protein [candidate division KSB1 bacterium]
MSDKTDKNEDYYLKLRKKIRNWIDSKGGKESKWGEIIITAPDMFHLLWKLSTDPEVPAKSKAILMGVIVYFISPIDLLPEAVLGPMGYLDDIALTAFVLNRLVNETDPQKVRKHWAGEQDILILIKNILANADKFLGKGLWNRLKKRIGT